MDEICTHRKDVTALDLEDDLDVWDEKINQTSYDCYPVYKESQDQIMGVLDAKKYLRMANRTKEEVLKKTVLKPFILCWKHEGRSFVVEDEADQDNLCDRIG